MSNEATVVHRIQQGRKYIEALTKLSSTPWENLYIAYQQNVLNDVEKFVLIHPSYYSEFTASFCPVRGRRRFSEELLHGVSCNADVIWMYNCPKTEKLVADHVFPYSLGGPTLADNKLYLCSFHNEIKGNDIHLYPWENPLPTWLNGRIERIRKTLSNP